MKRSMFVCALVTLGFTLIGCALSGEEGTFEQERQEVAGGKLCLSSDDCRAGAYCTTETGDCLTPAYCKNQPCLAVCYGQCAKLESCGDATCAPGLVCCNESCGICTEPGGFCTQQICTPGSPL